MGGRRHSAAYDLHTGRRDTLGRGLSSSQIWFPLVVVFLEAPDVPHSESLFFTNEADCICQVKTVGCSHT